MNSVFSTRLFEFPVLHMQYLILPRVFESLLSTHELDIFLRSFESFSLHIHMIIRYMFMVVELAVLHMQLSVLPTIA